MPLTTYNNVSIPSFMYGTAWKKEATTGLVLQAVEAGFTAIDTANQLVHYDEARVGEALLQLAKQGITRDKLFLQTKFTPSTAKIIAFRTMRERVSPPGAAIFRRFSRTPSYGLSRLVRVAWSLFTAGPRG